MPEKLQASYFRYLAVGLLLLLLGPPALANEDSDNRPLFDQQSTLNIRIEGPLSTLQKERSNTEYLNGKLSYRDEAGDLHEINMKFRTRGNYRRRRSTCWFPPVRLKFKAKQVANTVFAGQKILKLVSHCNSSKSNYEQLILKEYLAYRILQLHTPYSFRTRLLRITWVDTEKKNSTIEKYGFVLEHKSRLSERLEATVSGISHTTYDKLDPAQTATALVFQYLIGNTDFSFVTASPDEACCHNGILLSGAGNSIFPIPYDFDFAGIVNAPYAEPNPKFHIKRVTKRLYRGHCSVNPELAKTISVFAENEQAVFDLITAQDGLSEKHQKRVLKFIGNFYDEIADQSAAVQFFSKECS
jgi:hypothetical protein